ncbi:glycolipid transfer protein [Dichomitus squalens]|uniref:Glycolipid transfer protein n=1 Tax=Dichomitus squalens TaxID=114155 RepID=A0A4Q9PY66_9APHY|nr:glycolipid transfer protein [Dichomitus squalens LYAD-421 SS1]EJF64353.1 glycolipid transfer protein [Dichomitus squalens LYAD-421 SS1]TBU24180.1 glycolipid transfer protein [Dichomitus squalens]TBU44685.1 glycolipid transfer protein [Dichomitus squalens]TBU59559.1 glycolipid transfer protein [Dichomitus squalens]
MVPYFETAKSFADVPITGDGVDTATFLLASTDFVNMFDLLGGGVFAFVQNDLRSNITGVRQRFDAAPSESGTLEKLVVNECQRRGERHGTACLVRLVRGLWFTCEALRNMQQDRNAELHVCFRRSFDVVLKPRLSFVVRSVVSVAIMAVPSRHDFYNRLAQGGSHEKFDDALTRWLASLDALVLRLKAFLSEGRYGTV